MKKIIVSVLCGLMLASVASAARMERDPRDAAPEPTPPTPPVTVSNGNGNINSSASASTNTGGNQGGTVVTGDESSTVTVINIGPTNTYPPQNPPAPAPEDTSCSGRGCRSR